ncbi:MAG: UDP-4-amino-4,6-dideoxy-N-acetyl-beta-L-altrosamine transaminase, partial [Gammaproteobacteria bacterium]|nr:UDP-4-amino-4,6-dideoxy-N-acetyl-beta-L-altrosamine transaminase [Gammaproteobacteria bacterium]
MIPYSTQLIDQSDIDAVVSVLKSSNLTQGKEVEKFEQALCQYINAQYAVTFNSATSALLAAYSISGIVKNDEIITTPISFVATTNMAIAVGAKPVFCDIKLDGNIDEHLIESLITKKTKAIV